MTLQKRLKLALLVLLGVAGVTLFAFSQFQPEQTASASHKTVLFGSVDLAEDEADDTDLEIGEADSEDDEEETSWLEDFITNHKTPWSKEVVTED